MLDRAGGTAAALLEERYARLALAPGSAVELKPARPAELIAALSGAFDLAEQQPRGHAARVAHIATAVVLRLGLDAAAQRTVLYAALLHDAGIALGELPDTSALRGHAETGAWLAERFGLGARVAEAIRCSHERWDGEGRPRGLAMTEIPTEALALQAAHWACDAVSAAEHPLRARADLQRARVHDLAAAVGTAVADALVAVLEDDRIWMELWDDRLPAIVARTCGAEGRASLRHVLHYAAAFGEVVDLALRQPGRSGQVSALAEALALEIGVHQSERRAIAVAARLLDIGQLGVPRHVTEKPAILSVQEMEIVQRHASWGALILAQVPGWGEIARWVEAHHERADGRGYPEMLAGDEVPLPARILAVADGYCALRFDRPQRPAFDETSALRMIEEGAGSCHDAAVAMALRAVLASLRESAQITA